MSKRYSDICLQAEIKCTGAQEKDSVVQPPRYIDMIKHIAFVQFPLFKLA